MAIFGRKKDNKDVPGPAAGNGAAAGGKSEAGKADLGAFSPEKARKFFDYAQTTFDSGQYEYSMKLWLGGLRQDPTSMTGMEGFLAACLKFKESKEGAKGPSRETLNEFSGKGELDRYLRALLDWGMQIKESYLAVRAMDAAANVGLTAAATWLAERALKIALSDSRARKDYLVSIMEVFRKFERFDLAVQAGEAAVRMDPADTRLAADVRNISAEGTMSKGGFDQSGEEGGYRRNIKDAESQRRQEEQGRIVKTEEVQARSIASARSEYHANPLDRTNIKKYAQLLLERGEEADQVEALRVLTEAYRTTQDYFFKEQADALVLRIKRRAVAVLKAAADAPGASAEARRAFEQGSAELAEQEIGIAEAQVAAYPTDLAKRFELGKRYFAAGRFEEAIGQFQDAKADAKLRTKVLHALGVSFLRIGWADEAVDTLRDAAASHPTTDDELGMELRYGLMTALQTRAVEQRDQANAEEAYKIASTIAATKITYRDIRVKRDELKRLVTELKGGAGMAGAPPA